MKKKLLFSLLALSPLFSGAQTLIGSWSFNGNANDNSGNGLNGTVYNATLTTGKAGVVNTAYHFNGTNAHIDVPYNSLLNLSNWTIQIAYQVDAFSSSTCQEENLLTRGTYLGSDFMLMSFNDDIYDGSCTTYSPNYNEFIAGPAGNITSTPYHVSFYLQTGVWYCHTVSYDGTYMKTYVNGTLTDSTLWSNQYNFSNSATVQPVLSFGYYPNGGTNYPYWFNGDIDYIKIWNGALSATQIVDSSFNVSVPTITNNTNNVSLYPNPGHSVVTISGNVTSASVDVQVINQLGQVMLTKHITTAGGHIEEQLSVADLPKGIYYVKLLGTGQSVLRLVIE